MKCKNCGKDLLPIDMSFTMKLISRGATEYYCKSCLGKHFGYSEETLDAFAKKWQADGCTLFQF